MKHESKLAARPTFDEADIAQITAQIADVLRSGRLILGPQTEALEDEFARFVGVKHAVAVSSCTAAIEIACRALGQTDGSSVVVPTNTCVATAAGVMHAGATVLLCGTDERDFCLDVKDAIRWIDDEVRAVVAVHLAGFVAHDFDELKRVCQERDVALIADCAHAHGSELRGARAGALGDVGCFSFYPTKIITSGVGGMLTTNAAALAVLARRLRHHGAKGGTDLEQILSVGHDWLMDEVRAVIARAQLRRLPDLLARRRAVAARYDALLAGTDVRPPVAAPGVTPSYYKYPVLLPLGVPRTRVRALLREAHGIEAGTLYDPPIHRMPAYRHLLDRYDLRRTDALLGRQLCLPMHASVDPGDCDEIVAALRRSIERALEESPP